MYLTEKAKKKPTHKIRRDTTLHMYSCPTLRHENSR